MNLRLADRVRSRLPGAGLLGWKRRDEEEKGALKARPKPTAESILWSPVELTEFELAADQRRPHELFVRPDVLRKARYHLTGSGERFGFLLGRRFSCPDTGSPWVEISDVLPSSVALPGRAEAPRFRLLRTAAAKEGEERGLELLGWYHEHRLLGIALTDLDVDLHRDNFQEPWQCALLFVSGGPKPAGAFIQPWDGQQYFSRSFVSFRELEDGAGEAPAGTRSTCIDWSNYEPDRPVRLTEPLGTGGGTSALEASPARRPVWDQTVRWENTTPIPHTVTADPSRARNPDNVRLPDGADPFDSGDMGAGDTFEHTFTVPGEYRYFCVPHEAAAMVGTIVVQP